METKIYSSSGFVHQCSTEELYVLTRHWLSDILFFEQELEFFRSLLQRCFSPIQKDGVTQIELIETKFRDLKTHLMLLKEGVNIHQIKLGEILDEKRISDSSDFNIIQSRLEGELFDFIKTFRVVKQELFKFNAKCQTSNYNI